MFKKVNSMHETVIIAELITRYNELLLKCYRYKRIDRWYQQLPYYSELICIATEQSQFQRLLRETEDLF